MHVFLRLSIIVGLVFTYSLAFSEDTAESWYAIIKLDNGRKKLYTRGDIFYSETDIAECFRIQDIKKDCVILIDVGSKKNVVITPGERVPLEGSIIVFEKTIPQKLSVEGTIK